MGTMVWSETSKPIKSTIRLYKSSLWSDCEKQNHQPDCEKHQQKASWTHCRIPKHYKENKLRNDYINREKNTLDMKNGNKYYTTEAFVAR